MALPDAINEQARLLTLNIHQEPAIDFGHLSPGMKVWPLYLDTDSGVWVFYARYAPGTNLCQHFHGGQVHFFTTKGRWNYAEYPDDVQSEGSYLFEAAGSVHALSVPDDGECAEGFMVAFGVNINFDADGNYLGTDHAGSIEATILEAAKMQGIDMPRYLRPSGKVAFTA
jgi:2,4'-dihydroxyacetophenone dioxygenase